MFQLLHQDLLNLKAHFLFHLLHYNLLSHNNNRLLQLLHHFLFNFKSGHLNYMLHQKLFSFKNRSSQVLRCDLLNLRNQVPLWLLHQYLLNFRIHQKFLTLNTFQRIALICVSKSMTYYTINQHYRFYAETLFFSSSRYHGTNSMYESRSD